MIRYTEPLIPQLSSDSLAPFCPNYSLCILVPAGSTASGSPRCSLDCNVCVAMSSTQKKSQINTKVHAPGSDAPTQALVRATEGPTPKDEEVSESCGQEAQSGPVSILRRISKGGVSSEGTADRGYTRNLSASL